VRKLHKFHGGVHPPEHKEESNGLPIAQAPLPARLVIPLRQHIGNPAKPVVQPGDRVLKGQMIGQADGYVSAAVHAPTSGIIVAVDMQPVPHPSGLPDLCVTLEADGEDRWIERHPLDYRNMDPSDLRNRLRDAGVVGLGGAVFPTFIKLNPGPKKKIQTLIINGAECEPWITADDRLMRERAREIVRGIEIMQFMMQAEEVLIGIEDNKPEAIEAMSAACAGTPFEVVPVPTLYPSGGEKQLIKILTGKEVPSGQRPLNIGVSCSNVATAYTVHRVVAHGEPVISRIVTVTGNVPKPQNFEVRVGTPMSEVVKLGGEPLPDTDRFILGGPMMGFTLLNMHAPVVKAIGCVIAASKALFPPLPPPVPCIRCGRCAETCPAELQPLELYWFSQGRNFGKAQEYNLFDCIECGCCSYVCPSHIPLVQYFRFAKSEIWAREKEKKAAEMAKLRFEFRQFRLEREKQERAAKHAKPPAGAAGASDSAADEKKKAILAAIERAKEKKAAVTPRNVDNLPPEIEAEIRGIDARRAELRQSAPQPEEQEK
jgi:electron transport complex protein RnfC